MDGAPGTRKPGELLPSNPWGSLLKHNYYVLMSGGKDETKRDKDIIVTTSCTNVQPFKPCCTFDCTLIAKSSYDSVWSRLIYHCFGACSTVTEGIKQYGHDHVVVHVDVCRHPSIKQIELLPDV